MALIKAGEKLAETHGMCYSRVYRIWKAMIKRCTNPNASDYRYYGGRGVLVCTRWLNSFENFLEDMQEPRDDETLDRVDNDGPYCLENCRWATRKEQRRNASNIRAITFRGRTKLISEWASMLGGSSALITNRLNKLGWSIERALTTPALPTKPKKYRSSSSR